MDFRNILVHAYDLVDHTIVWDIATVKVPILRQEVFDILADVKA